MPPGAIPGFDPDAEPSQPAQDAPEADLKGKGRASEENEGSELDEDTCAICLSDVWNKAEASPCHHNAFCFACIHTWCAMSRRCPLCNTAVDFLMTHVRSETDFQKHLLLPLASTSRGPADPPVFPAAADIDMAARRQLFNRHAHPRRKYEWGRRNRRVELDELEEEQLALQRRKWIYKHKLFAKHVASNSYTRYQSFTPSQFTNSQDRKSRVVRFARREVRQKQHIEINLALKDAQLQVFPNVDVEWLVTYLLQIMCQLDLRSDNAIRLLAEFLGFDEAEHFAQLRNRPTMPRGKLTKYSEVLTFARSPFTDLKNWDQFTQYDRPECREPSPVPPAARPVPPARRPLSPDPYNDRGPKRRRSSGGYAPRYVDSYVPDYRREPPRYASPPRRRSPSPRYGRIPSPEPHQNGRGRIAMRSPSPRAKERSFSPPPQQQQYDQPTRVIVLTDDDEDNISLGEFKTPPLPDRPASTTSISLRGFANAKARRESLQARLEAEKAEAAQRRADDLERRKAALAEKLKKEKAESAKKGMRDALKAKLMARLEEEKRRAEREARETKGKSAAYGGGTAWQNDAWNAGTGDAEQEQGFNREDELRRALEARAALGKTRIDPKARLLAQITALRAYVADM